MVRVQNASVEENLRSQRLEMVQNMKRHTMYVMNMYEATFISMQRRIQAEQRKLNTIPFSERVDYFTKSCPWHRYLAFLPALTRRLVIQNPDVQFSQPEVLSLRVYRFDFTRNLARSKSN